MQPSTWLPPGAPEGMLSAWASWGEYFIFIVLLLILIFLIIQWFYPREGAEKSVKTQLIILIIVLVVVLVIAAVITLPGILPTSTP